MYTSPCLVIAFTALVAAWMPEQDRAIIDRNGTNLFTASASVTGRRSLSTPTPLRGVNLGSLFVFEPWIASTEWKKMGCSGYKSEFDCVSALGQTAANTAFQSHWGTWINQTDINLMKTYGLNTIRVPVGYWMREDLVYASEHFPQGGLAFLEKLCGMASDAGLYIIMDLHGAPGAQTTNNSFTGQYAPATGFYVDYQFERALKFLEWMTKIIHNNDNYRNVGMIEIVNEPTQKSTAVGTMTSTYYPQAFARIRAQEIALGINSSDYLHIQTMNTKWGSGNPTTHLTAENLTYAAFDSHRYLKWTSSVPLTHAGYISTSCADATSLGVGSGNTPLIIGEWSLAVNDSIEATADWSPTTQQSFYKQWFAAQVQAYEKQMGWVFWNWKTQLGTDYRWSYKDAVTAGVIPTNLGTIAGLSVC